MFHISSPVFMRRFQLNRKWLLAHLMLFLVLCGMSSRADDTEGNIQRFDTREYSLNIDERNFAVPNTNIASEVLQSMAVALLRGTDAQEIRRLWTHSHPERQKFWESMQIAQSESTTQTLVLPKFSIAIDDSYLSSQTWTHAIAVASNRPIGTIKSNAMGMVMFAQAHDRNSKIIQVNDTPGVTKINSHWLIGYGQQGLTVNLAQMGISHALGTEHADVLIGGGRGTTFMHAGQGDDLVIGGAANDVLFGGDGVDLIEGGAGNDYMVGGEGNDRLLGGIGDDVLIGGAGDDELTGGAGNDVLIGGEGNDRLFGGDGIDLATFRNPMTQYRFTHISKNTWQVAHLPFDDKQYDGTDVLISVEKLNFKDITQVSIAPDSLPYPIGEDIDLQRLQSIPQAGPQGQTVWRLPARLLTENDISPTGQPIRLNEVVSSQRVPYPRNTWLKSDLGDIKHELNGDILISPLLPHVGRTNTMLIRYTIRDDAGRRAVMVNNSLTQIKSEAMGIARIVVRPAANINPIRSCFSDCVLAHEQSIAQLVGSKALRIFGTVHADEIRGNAQNNVLDGGGSADVMIGYQGDDLYFVDDENDQVIENLNEGDDIVSSKAVSYRLPENVEQLRLLPGAKIGIGNASNNQIIATETGSTLIGLGGNDALFGDDGDDILDGGMGDDYLTGGNGNDIYIWAPNEGNDIALIGPNGGFQSSVPRPAAEEPKHALQLRAGISMEDLFFERTGSRKQDLSIHPKTGTGSFKVLSWFEDSSRRLSHIENHRREILLTRAEIERLATK